LNRSTVQLDVDQLAQVGLVTIETKTLPGHGHMKEIRAAAGIFRLEALVM
jgi:predicted transcriptional regulator